MALTSTSPSRSKLLLSTDMCSWYSVSVDVLIQGGWRLPSELDDPELKNLTSRLIATILCSQADSTVKKYLGA